jgi:hypothetical protein
MAERKTDLGRREFTLAAALAMLSGVAITISGCGSDSPSTPSGGGGGTGGTGDKTGSISNNHGHRAVITATQLAGGALSLDIRGEADHPHSVDLTQAELAAIAANTRVSKDSSSDAGHAHTVTFN